MKQKSQSILNNQPQIGLLCTYTKSNKNPTINIYTKILLHPQSSIKISSISCGLNFTILQSFNKQLYSFGDNKYGQLGYSNIQYPQNLGEPRLIKINNSMNKSFFVQQVRCGFSHVVAFNQKEVYGWGQCQYGALGYQPLQLSNDWMPRRLPILISNYQKLLDVSCGNNTTIFNISNDFYAIGDNRHGQLGLILKKPTIQPEKISIPSLKTLSQTPKLVKVKAGNKFIVGLDQNGSLYGAGQLIKLGLHLKAHIAIPTGLCPIEQLTNQGYRMITNVKDFWCSQGLLIYFQQTQLIYYAQNKKVRLVTDIQAKQQSLMLSMNRVLVKNKQSVFEWDTDKRIIKLSYLDMGENEKIQQIQKDIIFEQQQFSLVNIQRDNTIVYVVHCSKENKSDRFLQKQQTKRLYHEEIDYDIKLNDRTFKQRRGNETSTLIEGQPSKLETTALKKQILQQKQIIRLYEQYVQKLQTENSSLKQKISSIESKPLGENLQTDYDNVNKSIILLKCMLKDMIQLHKK